MHYDTIQHQQKTDTVQKDTVVKKEIKYHAFVVKNKNKDFKTLEKKVFSGRVACYFSHQSFGL